MARFTVYEYKRDGLYRPFDDTLLFKAETSNLTDAVNIIIKRHPQAELVTKGKPLGLHYYSIMKTENGHEHENLGFYKL